jgi:hypothetical protein
MPGSARRSRTAWRAEQIGRRTPEQVATLEGALDPLTALVEVVTPR